MLETMLVINFLGMIVIPILAGFYFARKFKLSWKLFLAGGLTFIASQILHIPFVLALTPTFQAWGLIAYAAILGLLAGLFEETARYILFKYILKNRKTWNEGVYVGVGHGGMEAILLGIAVALTFVNMMAYRNIDLATVPSIPPEQLELAKQQIQAYWSAPPYLAILGVVERIFAMCLHVSLSVMVLYGLVHMKAHWFWLAVLWHAAMDGVAVYLGQRLSPLAVEGVLAVSASVSIWITLRMKPKLAMKNIEAEKPLEVAGQGTGRE